MVFARSTVIMPVFESQNNVNVEVHKSVLYYLGFIGRYVKHIQHAKGITFKKKQESIYITYTGSTF